MIKANEKFDINYIDPSGISKFNRCPAAYMFSRLLGLQNQNRTTLAMDYGTDFHEAVPYCYDKNTLDTAIEIFKNKWEKRDHPFDKKRNIQCAKNSLMEFTNSHDGAMCPYEVIKFDIAATTSVTISKNEIPFLTDIGGLLPLAGRIDAPVKWKSDSSIFALDYKTSGEVSPRILANFENCPQALAYTLALSHITGKEVKGLIIELIRVSEKNTQSLMHMVFVQEHQIISFIRFANNTAKRILECNEKQEWPRHCSGCAPYAMFGSPGYPCDYMMICNSPDPEAMYKFYNKHEPFHPFDIK